MDTFNTLSPQEAAVAGGIIGGFLSAVLVIGLIWYVLQVVACWRMFEKAGEKGWKAIIPIYNTYIMYKIVDMKGWFWALICIGIIGSIISSVSGYDNSHPENFDYGSHPLVLISTIVTGIVAICAQVIYSIRTSRAFGHGGGFAVGLFFLQPIFLMIIGYGKSKYNKKKIHANK